MQGVGFRPFVYRLAADMGLTGWIRNNAAGVLIEAYGTDERLAGFCRRIRAEAPPLAVILNLEHRVLPDESTEEVFSILASGKEAENSAHIAPDAALCADCLAELFDPGNRRFRHPFITCTNCGPRYSIITGTPYDRPNTTMAGFPLCPDCQREYHDPADRRFHAQPIACPDCGPQMRLMDSAGRLLAVRDEAVTRSVELLKAGRILAIKGIGGFHLAADACNHEAVKLLRERKKRDEKPFAVMVPDLAAARSLARIDEMEERLLASPEAPIVIARRTHDCMVSPMTAPGNTLLGLMLPYTPLHHLLFRNSPTFDVQGSMLEAGTGNHGPRTALVMTSANLSDEPIVFQDDDALQRLSGVADFFLLHDRPIHMRSDDSVIRVFQNRPLFYRRARGYAPRGIRLPFESPPLLAVGAELKSAVCLVNGNQAFLSQHIGDLQHTATCDSFRHTIRHLAALFEISAESIACDRHPDYLSSVYAADAPLPLVRVQHHHAHLAACMAENGLTGEVIGLIYDGTGFGDDGTVWGGEFLIGGYEGFRRAGHFRPVPMPGGDAAVREPWRMSLAYLHQASGMAAFDLDLPVTRCLPDAERHIFSAMLERGLNTPLTSSCGRLFDAVAALLDLRHRVSYDGQAAIELEALAETSDDDMSLPYLVTHTQGQPYQVDFSTLFPAILNDLKTGIPAAVIARRFHAAVARASVETCIRIAAESGIRRIVLSGGVFQNRLLSDLVYTALAENDLQVFTHRLTPPNDGCIALGQAAVAGWRARRNS